MDTDVDTLRAAIGDAVREFIAAVVIVNTEVAKTMGLGASDGQFLTLLANHGPLTAGRLAQLSGLTTGTVTGVIDRLERAGYVRRERDPGDRRKVIVTPVPEAVAGTGEHYRAYTELLDGVLSTRDATELRTIARFLTDLTAANPARGGS